MATVKKISRRRNQRHGPALTRRVRAAASVKPLAAGRKRRAVQSVLRRRAGRPESVSSWRMDVPAGRMSGESPPAELVAVDGKAPSAESQTAVRSPAPAGPLRPARVIRIDEMEELATARPNFVPPPEPIGEPLEATVPAASAPLLDETVLPPVSTEPTGAAPESVAVELPPSPLPAATADYEIATRDLFDAQGNLVIPPLAAPIPPNVIEPTFPEPPALVEPEPAWEDLPGVPQADPAQTEAAPLDVGAAQGPSALSGWRSLSVAGLVRLSLWPLKVLYWPLRMLMLRQKRRALHRHYQPDTVVEVAAGEIVPPASPPLKLAQMAVQFTAACVVLLLPLQIAVYLQDVNDARERLLEKTGEALGALRLGRDELQSLRLSSAAEQFQRAELAFSAVRGEFDRLNFFTKAILQAVPQGRRAVTTGRSLLDAGQSIAELGHSFSAAMANATERGGWQDWPSLLSVLSDFQNRLVGILPTVAHARTALQTLSLESIPIANRERFMAAAASLPEIEDALLDTAVVTRSLLRLTGADQWQRYLVVFQNNAELRATGGFIGSYALMDVEDGQVVNLEVPGGGSYDLQGSLLELVAAPEPLRLVNPRWEFQDANWWPDFPSSAGKLAWFLERSRGGSVDGVIALTNTVVERMLTHTGPLTLPAYGRTIDASNFRTETQAIVELEYDRQINRPKQFIADLAPALLERLQQLAPDQQQRALAELYQLLREKQLLVWSRDAQAQQVLDELGWTGTVEPVGLSDYLMVVNTNIRGGKTDQDVATSLRHSVTVEAEGQLIVTLTITRTHQGAPTDTFAGLQNNSFVRVYVPAGSRLINAIGFEPPAGAVLERPDAVLQNDADLERIEGEHVRDEQTGIDIYQAHGKTVFAQWLTVKPGEQKSATLTYQLPFRLPEAQHTYTLLVQKQPGSLGDELLSTVRLGPQQQVIRVYPEAGGAQVQTSDGLIQFHDRLVTDKFYGVVVAPTEAPVSAAVEPDLAAQ